MALPEAKKGGRPPSKLSAWRRKLLPRLTLLLWGDRAGICGAYASVVWLGREWLNQEIELREQNG